MVSGGWSHLLILKMADQDIVVSFCDLAEQMLLQIQDVSSSDDNNDGNIYSIVGGDLVQ